jgi:hypothetical protein
VRSCSVTFTSPAETAGVIGVWAKPIHNNREAHVLQRKTAQFARKHAIPPLFFLLYSLFFILFRPPSSLSLEHFSFHISYFSLKNPRIA